MKILEFDQFEFPYHSSEERLRLSIEAKSRSRDANAFVERCLTHEQRGKLAKSESPVLFESSHWRGELIELVAHFAPELVIELPSAHVTTLLNENGEHWLLLETPATFVLYEWSSAA